MKHKFFIRNEVRAINCTKEGKEMREPVSWDVWKQQYPHSKYGTVRDQPCTAEPHFTKFASTLTTRLLGTLPHCLMLIRTLSYSHFWIASLPLRRNRELWHNMSRVMRCSGWLSAELQADTCLPHPSAEAWHCWLRKWVPHVAP